MVSEGMKDNFAWDVKLEGTITGGLCWDNLTRSRMQDPRALERFGYKVYSQNDEDGILQEIFRRIGTTNKIFVEFGTQDGLESIGHYLLLCGWSGFWKAIDAVLPRVAIVEFNGKMPPDLNWKMAYDADHIWDGSDRHGASLKALELLGREKGYTLVGTSLNGVNAFFVRDDLVNDSFLAPHTAEYLYNPLRLDLKFVTNHPSRYFLGLQREGYGLLDYCDVELVMGFHSVEYCEGVSSKQFAWTSEEKSVLRLLKCRAGDTCVIPCLFPEQASEGGEVICELDVSSNSPGGEKMYAVKGKNAIYIYDIGDLPQGAIIRLAICHQKLWIPSETTELCDTRRLGIGIRFSEIEFLSAK